MIIVNSENLKQKLFQAVRKSRDKTKKKAEETMKRVKKLREDNKHLEGKIEEQKKTKKFLKDLFLQQTTNKMEKPSNEVINHMNPSLTRYSQHFKFKQWDLINDEDSSDHESDADSSSSMESEDEISNVGSPNYSTTSSTKR